MGWRCHNEVKLTVIAMSAILFSCGAQRPMLDPGESQSRELRVNQFHPADRHLYAAVTPPACCGHENSSETAGSTNILMCR